MKIHGEKWFMKVSVIVPTFNRRHLLKETMESILNQTFKDFELIIVDNYSTDNTEKLIRSYNDKRIRYFKNQNKGIVAVNRNFGIKKAKGELIAFCDDDDLWMPYKLEKQVAEFEKDDQVALVCTNGIAFNETGETGLTIKSHLRESDFTFKSLIFSNHICNSSVIVRKSVINDVGMLDEDSKIFGAEDYYLWVQLAKKYSIKYINLPLIKYRTHPGAYRRNEIESLALEKHVLIKLLKNKIIGSKLYSKAVNRLNYRYIITKLVNENDINFGAILQNKMSVSEKSRLLILYFLFRIRMFNNLRRIKHKIFYDNVNNEER